MGRIRKYAISAAFAAALLAGCSPKVIETVRTEYVYRDRVQRDTTVVRDSVFIREKVKGDTVFVEKVRDRLVYRDRWREKTDTVVLRDSVAVETVKEVKVEKPLSAWKRAKIGAFWWLLASLVAALVWIFRKPILKLVKTII